MERICILHNKFPAAHQPEARSDFITKLGLYLVKAERQLAIRPDQINSKCSYNFFMGWTEAQLPTLSILEMEHDPFPSCVASPASTALP